MKLNPFGTESVDSILSSLTKMVDRLKAAETKLVNAAHADAEKAALLKFDSDMKIAEADRARVAAAKISALLA